MARTVAKDCIQRQIIKPEPRRGDIIIDTDKKENPEPRRGDIIPRHCVRTASLIILKNLSARYQFADQ